MLMNWKVTVALTGSVTTEQLGIVAKEIEEFNRNQS